MPVDASEGSLSPGLRASGLLQVLRNSYLQLWHWLCVALSLEVEAETPWQLSYHPRKKSPAPKS
jgi:hypothetical protein